MPVSLINSVQRGEGHISDLPPRLQMLGETLDFLVPRAETPKGVNKVLLIMLILGSYVDSTPDSNFFN